MITRPVNPSYQSLSPKKKNKQILKYLSNTKLHHKLLDMSLPIMPSKTNKAIGPLPTLSIGKTPKTQLTLSDRPGTSRSKGIVPKFSRLSTRNISNRLLIVIHISCYFIYSIFHIFIHFQLLSLFLTKGAKSFSRKQNQAKSTRSSSMIICITTNTSNTVFTLSSMNLCRKIQKYSLISVTSKKANLSKSKTSFSKSIKTPNNFTI